MPWPSNLPPIPSHRSIVDYYTRHRVAEYVSSARDLFELWSSTNIAGIRWIIPKCLGSTEPFVTCFRGKHHLLLPTFDGCVEYRPRRVMRQMGLPQPVPVLDRSDKAIQFYMMSRYEEVGRFRTLWSDYESVQIPHVPDVGDVASSNAYFGWFTSGKFHELEVDGEVMRQDFANEADYWRHCFEEKEKELQDHKRETKHEMELRDLRCETWKSAFHSLKNKEGISGQKEANLRLYGSYTELLARVIQAKVILNGGLPPLGLEVFTFPDLSQGDDGAGPSHS